MFGIADFHALASKQNLDDPSSEPCTTGGIWKKSPVTTSCIPQGQAQGGMDLLSQVLQGTFFRGPTESDPVRDLLEYLKPPPELVH